MQMFRLENSSKVKNMMQVLQMWCKNVGWSLKKTWASVWNVSLYDVGPSTGFTPLDSNSFYAFTFVFIISASKTVPVLLLDDLPRWVTKAYCTVGLTEAKKRTTVGYKLPASWKSDFGPRISVLCCVCGVTFSSNQLALKIKHETFSSEFLCSYLFVLYVLLRGDPKKGRHLSSLCLQHNNGRITV